MGGTRRKGFVLLVGIFALLAVARPYPIRADTLNVPTDDYPTIQAAINHAAAGDTVEVQPGTYAEHIDFLGKAITVRSKTPDDPAVVESTIIDGGGTGIGVRFVSGETRSSVLMGFTVRSCAPGIMCIDASPTISKNWVTNNHGAFGAGITCGGGAPLLTDNVISHNDAGAASGGGVGLASSSAILNGNTIENNRGSIGGGVAAYSGGSAVSVEFNDNVISGNFASVGGGGVVVGLCGSATFRRNIVHANRIDPGIGGGAGIWCYYVTNVEITDNEITDNTSAFGACGGVGCSGGTSLVTGNLISGNATGMDGQGGGNSCFAGIGMNDGAIGTISGNIITDNHAYWYVGGVGVGSGSVVEGNTISNNTSEHWAGGIGATSGPVTIRANTITGNSAPQTGAISMSASGSIEDNVISFNTASAPDGQGAVIIVGAPYVTVIPYVTVSGNIITDNISSSWGAVVFAGSNGDVYKNTIRGNDSSGVDVRDSGSVWITQNSIAQNGGLGIDLGGDGVTLNHPGGSDTGPNNLQNYPCLLSAVCQNGTTTITGKLNSTPVTDFTLEFFGNSEGDPSGYGEGETYLGAAAVTTDGAGNASFTVTLPVICDHPELITSTATDPDGNTSEFSRQLPQGQLESLPELITLRVASGQIAPELENSLLAKINAATAALAGGNKNAAKVAMNDLKAFINQVEAQTGKKINAATAAEVIAHANQIIADLGS